MTLTLTRPGEFEFRSLVDQRRFLLKGSRGQLRRSAEDIADGEVRVIGVDLGYTLFGAAFGVCGEVGHALDGVGLGVGHGDKSGC